MADFSFSRSHLSELTVDFSANLKETKATFEAIKSEFITIESQWQGGDSEKATMIFKKIGTSLDKISNNLNEADRFIQQKADGFNNLHFTG